jgi:hypothetical protein
MYWTAIAERRALPARSGTVRLFPFLILIVAVSECLMVAALAGYAGRPWAALILLSIPVAWAWKTEPWKAASALAGGSMFLRLAYIGTAHDDQIIVTQAALGRVLHGLSPYGVGYAQSTPSGAPFPYGPLALLWWIPGPAVELAAAAGIMALLIHYRSWLALAVFCAFPPFVFLNTSVNDYSPALLIGLGLVLLPRWQGAVLMAAAVALKPYAIAWFLPAIGFAGLPALLALSGVTALLWSPLLFWGPGTFVESIRMVDVDHASSLVRYLAAPLSALGFLWRSRTAMVLTGSASFAVLMLSSGWWSLGYLVPVLVALGLLGDDRRLVGQEHAPDVVVLGRVRLREHGAAGRPVTSEPPVSW